VTYAIYIVTNYKGYVMVVKSNQYIPYSHRKLLSVTSYPAGKNAEVENGTLL